MLNAVRPAPLEWEAVGPGAGEELVAPADADGDGPVVPAGDFDRVGGLLECEGCDDGVVECCGPPGE